jgi:hypothetical protein
LSPSSWARASHFLLCSLATSLILVIAASKSVACCWVAASVLSSSCQTVLRKKNYYA